MIVTDCKKCGGHKPVNSIKDRLCFQCIETEKKIKQLEDEIVEWKLKYIAVCEKKDILDGK